MARGGKREGAGRPPEISPEDTARILEDCRQRARVAQKQQQQATTTRELGRLPKGGARWGEDDEVNPLHLVSVPERSSVSRYGIFDTKSAIPEDLSDEAIYAIETMRQNRLSIGKRLGREIQDGEQVGMGLSGVPLPRLYQGRAAIIEAVAKAWGATERQVRTIWEGAEDDV